MAPLQDRRYEAGRARRWHQGSAGLSGLPPAAVLSGSRRVQRRAPATAGLGTAILVPLLAGGNTGAGGEGNTGTVTGRWQHWCRREC